MNEQAVREKVREVVGEMAPFQEERVLSSSLLVDLGYDSLGFLECICAIEQEFELGDIEEGDMAVDTVEDIEQLVLTALRATERRQDAVDAH